MCLRSVPTSPGSYLKAGYWFKFVQGKGLREVGVDVAEDRTAARIKSKDAFFMLHVGEGNPKC